MQWEPCIVSIYVYTLYHEQDQHWSISTLIGQVRLLGEAGRLHKDNAAIHFARYKSLIATSLVGMRDVYGRQVNRRSVFGRNSLPSLFMLQYSCQRAHPPQVLLCITRLEGDAFRACVVCTAS